MLGYCLGFIRVFMNLYEIYLSYNIIVLKFDRKKIIFKIKRLYVYLDEIMSNTTFKIFAL